jgi:hypothetical protein
VLPFNVKPDEQLKLAATKRKSDAGKIGCVAKRDGSASHVFCLERLAALMLVKAPGVSPVQSTTNWARLAAGKHAAKENQNLPL